MLELYQEPAMMNVVSVKFSPDVKLLAVGTDVGTVTLWDLASGALMTTCKGHTRHVNALAFSPKGDSLATAGADKTVRFWDVQTGQERMALKAHDAQVQFVAYSPDEYSLLTASEDGAVKIWTAATDDEAHARRSTQISEQPLQPLASTYELLSWNLVIDKDTEPDGVRRAVELAERAISAAPESGSSWGVLGAAYSRAGQWQKSLEALDRSDKLRPEKEDAVNGFFRAIALWNLNQKEQARRSFERAARWVDQKAPLDAYFKPFREEAAAVLGLGPVPGPANTNPAKRQQ